MIPRGIADALLAGWPDLPGPRAGRRAAIILVVGFWGWHSLQRDAGLSVEDAANLAASMILPA